MSKNKSQSKTAKETYCEKSSSSIPCINNYMESLQWLLCDKQLQKISKQVKASQKITNKKKRRGNSKPE
jgi:hypothetical protein